MILSLRRRLFPSLLLFSARLTPHLVSRGSSAVGVAAFLHSGIHPRAPSKPHAGASSTSRLDYDAYSVPALVEASVHATPSVHQAAAAAAIDVDLPHHANYAPAATALFVNMLTPASILAAGMISLGLKAPFQMPTSIQDRPAMVRHVRRLQRAYIVVTLIGFCSELLAVMWATVAVNQLTENPNFGAPASDVWELLRRDCDLEWAAVNTHFIVGLVGFMYMVGIRGYVMLLAAEASPALVVSTVSGVGAALLLMFSIVNRGVASGGGAGSSYGETVLDLFGHYISLLYQRSIGGVDMESFGPLGLGAIALELVSISAAVYAVLGPLQLEANNTGMDDSLASSTTQKEKAAKDNDLLAVSVLGASTEETVLGNNTTTQQQTTTNMDSEIE